MLDPDAPGGTFTHWLAYGLSPGISSLAALPARRPRATPRPEPTTRCVRGCRRALPALRASALGAWPGWSLSRWRLTAGRKSGPEPAEEPAQVCRDPGRARTRQTDCSSG